MDEEAYRDLANAIVGRAVQDWRNLCQKAQPYTTAISDARQMSFDTLRRFFNSRWCATLCGNVDPQYILNKLENERIDILTQRGIL